MSIELVMPSDHLILCYPLLHLPSIFPSIRVFPMSQFFTSGGQSIGVSASTSVLPVNMGHLKQGFPDGSDCKEICLQCRRSWFNPWVKKIS